jgi:hypothetical protein
MKQILRYTKQQSCKITHWHLTSCELAMVLDELNVLPHQVLKIMLDVDRVKKYKVFDASIKIIPSTSERP